MKHIDIVIEPVSTVLINLTTCICIDQNIAFIDDAESLFYYLRLSKPVSGTFASVNIWTCLFKKIRRKVFRAISENLVEAQFYSLPCKSGFGLFEILSPFFCHFIHVKK